jgi:hypothetical protein
MNVDVVSQWEDLVARWNGMLWLIVGVCGGLLKDIWYLIEVFRCLIVGGGSLKNMWLLFKAVFAGSLMRG